MLHRYNHIRSPALSTCLKKKGKDESNLSSSYRMIVRHSAKFVVKKTMFFQAISYTLEFFCQYTAVQQHKMVSAVREGLVAGGISYGHVDGV